jgi:hypothetical protein
MNRFLLGVLVGVLLASILAQPAIAQTAMRIFGTLSTGTARAILVDSTGAVTVGF